MTDQRAVSNSSLASSRAQVASSRAPPSNPPPAKRRAAASMVDFHQAVPLMSSSDTEMDPEDQAMSEADFEPDEENSESPTLPPWSELLTNQRFVEAKNSLEAKKKVKTEVRTNFEATFYVKEVKAVGNVRRLLLKDGKEQKRIWLDISESIEGLPGVGDFIHVQNVGLMQRNVAGDAPVKDMKVQLYTKADSKLCIILQAPKPAPPPPVSQPAKKAAVPSSNRPKKAKSPPKPKRKSKAKPGAVKPLGKVADLFHNLTPDLLAQVVPLAKQIRAELYPGNVWQAASDILTKNRRQARAMRKPSNYHSPSLEYVFLDTETQELRELGTLVEWEGRSYADVCTLLTSYAASLSPNASEILLNALGRPISPTTAMGCYMTVVIGSETDQVLVSTPKASSFPMWGRWIKHQAKFELGLRDPKNEYQFARQYVLGLFGQAKKRIVFFVPLLNTDGSYQANLRFESELVKHFGLGPTGGSSILIGPTALKLDLLVSSVDLATKLGCLDSNLHGEPEGLSLTDLKKYYEFETEDIKFRHLSLLEIAQLTPPIGLVKTAPEFSQVSQLDAWAEKTQDLCICWDHSDRQDAHQFGLLLTLSVPDKWAGELPSTLLTYNLATQLLKVLEAAKRVGATIHPFFRGANFKSILQVEQLMSKWPYDANPQLAYISSLIAGRREAASSHTLGLGGWRYRHEGTGVQVGDRLFLQLQRQDELWILVANLERPVVGGEGGCELIKSDSSYPHSKAQQLCNLVAAILRVHDASGQPVFSKEDALDRLQTHGFSE